MKTLNFVVDFAAVGKSWSDLKAVEAQGPKMFFERLLNLGLQSVYQEGLSNASARRLARVLNAVDLAKGETIEVDDEDFKELFVRIFEAENVRWPTAYARVVAEFQARVEAGKKS